MKEILTSCPSDGPSLPPPTSRSCEAGDLQQDGKGMSLLPTSHLQSLNGSENDRNLPSAVLSTCLVSDDPRIGEVYSGRN